ncbi:exodeoxyribonuclease V subunit alpha [Thorsellia anophelis]|uniref:RecBCD enzyme subunit RecD n=1 Tax=Thorsellia anophelis DSM 18579 TaxID=1123402 RepID=A0A1H9Z7C2_9GAMM|nr:exodeoxyribonuclease V subunit alpha [Thorsellia anophelis]SES77430.1 DNA helicase/exodeoxyribonuclease V, alpha subunit [Thorsellia anophelis DSM 18579]
MTRHVSTMIQKISLSTPLMDWFESQIASDMIAVIDKQLTFFLMRFCQEKLSEIERDQLAIFLCYLSHKMAQGDVCIRIDNKISKTILPAFFTTLPLELQRSLTQLTSIMLIDILNKSELAIIAETDIEVIESLKQVDSIPPIIMVGNRIYWQRMWEDEHKVADYLVKQSKQADTSPFDSMKSVLNQVFANSDCQIDRQKIAGAIALSKSISIISGGPGTGKTTTVAGILLSALRLNPNKRLRILLAAPTGKAAARLTESLLGARNQFVLSESEKENLALEAVTLHRLLGASLNGDGFRHHNGNPLHGDILVVDEASMIDLRLMSALIDALSPTMRVILLGDKDQLSSVAPGRVLGDICSFGQLTFSHHHANYLAELMSLELETLYDPALSNQSTVGDVIGLLTKSRRFAEDSKIGKLATAINTQKRKEVESLLLDHQCEFDGKSAQFLAKEPGFKYVDFADTENYEKAQCYEALLNDCLIGFKPYLELVAAFVEGKPLIDVKNTLSTIDEQNTLSQENSKESEAIIDILKQFNKFRVLASIHSGLFGTDSLNENLILRLQEAKLITRSRDKHFIGRPILITRNDASLKLFNGDIGVTLRDLESGQMRVYFLSPTGQLQSVVPSRLPEHETAFVMTVHKSQGSEFEHTLIVLPDVPNPVLTKELIYTAVTRARTQLTLYSSMQILQGTIRQLTPRTSGLIDQIQVLSQSEYS